MVRCSVLTVFFPAMLMRFSMFQVYQCLSAPGDSKMARQMFKDLKNGLFNSDQGNKSKSNEAESQSSQSYNTSSKLEDSNVTVPPLNPFIVPVTLLKRSKWLEHYCCTDSQVEPNTSCWCLVTGLSMNLTAHQNVFTMCLLSDCWFFLFSNFFFNEVV